MTSDAPAVGKTGRATVTRLAIFSSHPIQNQAPWFRALAATDDFDIHVYFSHVPDALEQGTGFGRPIAWDIPLREGYPSTVLKSKPLPTALPTFARRHTIDAGTSLQAFRPDVAMILGWQELSLVQALLTCRKQGIPIIMRGESNALRKRTRFVSALHRQYLARCDAFLAIGRSNAEFYQHSGIPRDRVATAGYFVDNARFEAAADALRSQRSSIRQIWGIDGDATCFLFAGKLEPKKRIMHYLEGLRLALAAGAPVCGLVAGTGEQMEESKAFCRAHALPVAFAGFLNQTEISRAYSAADAIVLPSDYGETWGLVVNEAMASRLPAIVSDRVGSAHDLVLDGKTGMVFPFGDCGALAAAMMRLISDRSARQRMGREAHRHVTANYSIERAVEGTRAAAAIARQRRAHGTA